MKTFALPSGIVGRGGFCSSVINTNFSGQNSPPLFSTQIKYRLEFFTPSRKCSNNLSAGRGTYDSRYGKCVSYHLFHIYTSLVYIKENSKLQGHYACNWGFYNVQ